MLDALRLMDKLDCKLLMVTDDAGYRTLLSIGDIQRAIIDGCGVDVPIHEILRENIRVAHAGESFSSIKAMMLQFRTEFMPVLDESGGLADVYFWDELFSEGIPAREQIDLPVVIMAGGKGTRLKPFSNILPKALFPIGEKTILEMILDNFKTAGCSRFLLSVNHKNQFIRTYLDQLESSTYEVEYFQEDRPLGTAGSLHLVRDRVSETFFLSNCDIVIDTDYSEVLTSHYEHDNEITIVAALKNFSIPYGTLESGGEGQLLALREKPEMKFLINAGLYLLEPHLLSEIPQGDRYDITDLINAVRTRGGRVGVFPVSERSWCDIGEWEEYRRTMSRFGMGSFL